MFDSKQLFLIISSVLAFSTPFFYAYDILKGKAQPHRTTRLVLLVITMLAFTSLLAQQNQVAVWLAGFAVFQSVTVFLLSIKYGVGGWAKLDLLCLAIAAFGIIIWRVTNNPVLALYASLFADFTGIFPTLVKTYKKPQSESFAYFFIGLISTSFSVLAVGNLNLREISYPIYLTIINSIMVILITKNKLRKIL